MARVKLAAFARAISGRMGGVVYKDTKFGTEMAEFEAPSNPNTAAQQAVRNDFKKSSQQWRNLSTGQAAAWRAFAANSYNTEEVTTKRYKPTGFNAFVKLAAKWYAVNSTGTAPANPPATAFVGDTITVTAAPGGAGLVSFTASAPNSLVVTTQLLIQRVPNANAVAIKDAFKIGKYFKFVTGTLSTTVAVTPGYYAVGYQFVSTVTGQASSPVLLGIVGPVGFEMVSGNEDTASKKKAA